MAAPESIFEKEVDRTPVGACWGLVCVAGVLFLAGAIGLWRAAIYVKRLHISTTLPTISLPKNLGQQAQSAAEKALQDQKQKTESSAKQTINQEVNQEKNAVEQDASESLKNSLHL
jgi:hypothetical protein